MVAPSAPADGEEVHRQRARDSAISGRHRMKAFGIIAILVLSYAGLLLIGRKYGPGGHHVGESHAPSAGEAKPEQAPPKDDSNHSGDESRSGDHHRSGDRSHSGDHDRSGDPNRSDDHHRSNDSVKSGDPKQSPNPNPSDESKRAGDSNRAGGSVRSFLLVSTIGYLALLFAWAAMRRRWAFLARHVVSAAAMWLIVVQYLNARGGFEYNVHSWNRAFADASLVLYAVTLAIGPLARLWRPASRAMAWRRETGIWATIAAAVHIGLFWEKHYGWSGWRQFFYPVAHGSGAIADTLMGNRPGGLVPTALNLANVVGLVALAYALVLTLTSNDASQRWLKRGWSWLQERATTMQFLVLLHTWLFAYYITPESGLVIGTLWICFWTVLLLQTAAFVKTVWFRQRPEDPSGADGTQHNDGDASALSATPAVGADEKR